MQGRRRDGFGKCGSGLEDVKEENYTVADRLPLSTPFFSSLSVGKRVIRLCFTMFNSSV